MIPCTPVLEDHTASVLRAEVSKVWKVTEVSKGEAVPVLNYAHDHQNVWGSGDIAPPFSTLAIDGGE
jgi:hypothetical protein